MKSLQLPKMSTAKPPVPKKNVQNEDCTNHLKQQFQQKAPNLVWVSDITYIKVNSRWYYLCIIMDLFSRKAISWHISDKPDTDLVITTFKKAYEKRNYPYGLMFHSDRGTQYTAFSFRQLLDSLDVVQSFSKKDILLIMPVVNVSLNTSKKKKQIVNITTPLKNYSFPYLNISKDTIIPKDHMGHWECLRLMR